jgi:hypothetical protein
MRGDYLDASEYCHNSDRYSDGPDREVLPFKQKVREHKPGYELKVMVKLM